MYSEKADKLLRILTFFVALLSLLILDIRVTNFLVPITFTVLPQKTIEAAIYIRKFIGHYQMAACQSK